jgi:hypothetical protein
MKQIHTSANGNEDEKRKLILNIVEKRGKMHNPGESDKEFVRFWKLS